MEIFNTSWCKIFKLTIYRSVVRFCTNHIACSLLLGNNSVCISTASSTSSLLVAVEQPRRVLVVTFDLSCAAKFVFVTPVVFVVATVCLRISCPFFFFVLYLLHIQHSRPSNLPPSCPPFTQLLPLLIHRSSFTCMCLQLDSPSCSSRCFVLLQRLQLLNLL